MRVNVNQTKSSNQIVPQQELSSNEKTVTSMDVTEEDEEEEKKIQKIERKSRPSYFRTLFSLRNLLTLFMSGLSMMTIVVLGGMYEICQCCMTRMHVVFSRKPPMTHIQ